MITFGQETNAATVAAALAAIGARDGGWVHVPNASEGGSAVLRAQLSDRMLAEQALDILSRQPGVAGADLDRMLHVDAVSNDPGYTGGSLWGLYGDKTNPANAFGSGAGEAWQAGYTGSAKVVVGVVDSGVDYTHPDLYLNIWLNPLEIPAAFRASLTDVNADGLISFLDLNAAANSLYVADVNANGRIDGGDLLGDARWENGVDDDRNGFVDDLIGWDFVNGDNDPYDDNRHGTHVAGTIAASGGNGVGVAGVTWSTQIVPLKFLSASGTGPISAALQAIDYFTAASAASTGQKFVATNNSWGGGGYAQPLADAIARGAARDILFVGAAGNGGLDGVGDNNDRIGNYPSNYDTSAAAGYDAVVAVASITSAGQRSSFSNYGAATVDLGAPGSAILSALPGGGYGTLNGTSMATPHVTGAIALYASVSDASAAEIRANLLASAVPTPSLAGVTATGGRLDVTALLALDTHGADLRFGTEGADRIEMTRGGADRVSGGGGDDVFAFAAAFDAADRIDGGAGADTLTLEGRYVGASALDLTAAQLVDVETLVLLGGGTAYALTTVDANVIGAAVLTIDASDLAPGETLDFDGSAERDGRFVATGGAGDDVLRGGAGADRLDGGTGADHLAGGRGNDLYVADDLADLVFERPGEGVDEVRTALGSRSDYSRMYVLGDAIENFTGSSAAAQGVRLNALDNIVMLGAGGDLAALDDGGNDRVAGGGGSDFLYFGGAFTNDDAVDGGAGFDTVGLVGHYAIAFEADDLVSIEKLALYSSGNPAAPSEYRITMSDANVAAGIQLMVVAQSLQPAETLLFDGTAETNGSFNVRGGRGADTITGGAGADRIWGALGADTLRGGAGSDMFEYRSAGESGGSARDVIADFGAGDRINLIPVDADGNMANGNTGFRFVGPAAFSGMAGELRVQQDSQDARLWTVEADTNGDRLPDLAITVVTAPDHPLSAADFWL
ncbi:S8 family serine peptidase [Sphingosinicella sp. BN140058]|uniref:S8 family serine peptidase n=1 Tax=Sphingosinicella sp. BN140058 TaxID=1892855 RepID=UPI00197DA6EA|nr:S8 family serine peptidase [Sphingosinicella sp. BN140058]